MTDIVWSCLTYWDNGMIVRISQIGPTIQCKTVPEQNYISMWKGVSLKCRLACEHNTWASTECLTRTLDGCILKNQKDVDSSVGFLPDEVNMAAS